MSGMSGKDDRALAEAIEAAAAQAATVARAVVAAELAVLAAMVPQPGGGAAQDCAVQEAEIEDGFDNMPV